MAIELVIDVTAEDIFFGVKDNCGKCPVATATLRAAAKAGISVVGFRETPYVSVGFGKIVVGKSHGWLPESAVEFIGQFDAGDHVDPFQFPVTLYSVEAD